MTSRFSNMNETKRIYNFSSGPATMPLPVLEKAQNELLSFQGSGMSVMELSHRSDMFGQVLKKAENGVRELLTIPEHYQVLFLQGGATLQFSMVPMNFLAKEDSADYVVTGAWGKKAVLEASLFGNPTTVYSTERSGFRDVPAKGEIRINENARYLHYTSNETIDGVQFAYEIEGVSIPVVCDMSSDILSKPIDVENFALIYAGAQKNIGPSGVTVVIIRDDLIERTQNGLPPLLNYRDLAKNESMVNTPNTWGIYLIGLVCDWLRDQGGVAQLEKINREKASRLYDAIDASDGFYRGHASPRARSLMNVTFRLGSSQLEEQFCMEAAEAGLNGLGGHRSVGGIRASIYNAFPSEGVESLIEFMEDFSRRNN